MHELSVCQSLLDEVRRIAHERGACSVDRVVIRLGPLSGVDPHLLRQAFFLARAGTLAHRAKLEIEIPPIEVICESCGARSKARANRLICAICGDWHTRLASGDQLQLHSLDLEFESESKEATRCAQSVAAD